MGVAVGPLPVFGFNDDQAILLKVGASWYVLHGGQAFGQGAAIADLIQGVAVAGQGVGENASI